jgi:hypothetical protein
MNDALQPSPVLVAQELIRRNLSSLTLDELKDHRTQATETLLALSQFRASAWMSANAVAHVMHLERKLLAHLHLLQESIEDWQASLAAMQAEAQDAERHRADTRRSIVCLR